MIGTTAAIIGAAAVGAAATVNASNQATKAAKTAAAANQQTIANTQAQNTALMQPYVDSGVKATDAIDAFLGIGGDAKAQQEAFSNWRNSVGYQFNLNQGLDATSSNKAAAGLLKSGSTLKALNDYAQNTANQYGQQYLSNLQTAQNAGLNAAGTTVNANTNAAGQTIANTNALAQAKSDNAQNQSAAFNNFLGSASGVLSSYGGLKTDSSYGGGVLNSTGQAGKTAATPWANTGIYKNYLG